MNLEPMTTNDEVRQPQRPLWFLWVAGSVAYLVVGIIVIRWNEAAILQALNAPGSMGSVERGLLVLMWPVVLFIRLLAGVLQFIGGIAS